MNGRSGRGGERPRGPLSHVSERIRAAFREWGRRWSGQWDAHRGGPQGGPRGRGRWRGLPNPDGFARRRLMARIVVPTMVVLCVVPAVSCVVFIGAARGSSYQEASQDMDNLQRMLMPLMESQSVDADPGQETEPGRSLLMRISRAAHGADGSARAMVLTDDMRLVYPYDTWERDATSALTEEMIAALADGTLRAGDDSVIWRSSQGEYLVQVYDVLGPVANMGYVVTYCETNHLDAWVEQAGIIVWVVSAMLALTTLAVLWAAARGARGQLEALGAEARRMGDGDFTPIAGPIDATELENMRVSLNDMAGRLERNDRAQKDFLQNVSHELRNPLMSIGGYAQGLEQGVFDDPRQAARVILEESGRLGELVDDLLTLSRMESGDRRVRMEPVALVDIVADAIDRFRGLALRAGVTLVTVPRTEDAVALADEEMLGRVLDNLLSNAIRYARSTVTVEVRGATDASDDVDDVQGGAVAVTVRDDGDGIDDADMPHLFERCYKGRGGHFGLGLSIARAASDTMDGRLEASNAVRDDGTCGGAVFTLTLRRA